MAFNYFDNSSAIGLYQRDNTVGVNSLDSNRQNTLAVGGVLFTTTGSHSWTVPEGVTSVCVVCVGGGGGGLWYNNSSSSYSYSMAGGDGGALAWLNDYPVVPGNSYTVRVGAGGDDGAYQYGSTPGTYSYFVSASICQANGGEPGRYNSDGDNSTYTVSTLYGTYGGGLGGKTDSAGSSGYGPAGGGGAGGYSGTGGTGRDDSAASGTAGAGGGGGGGGASSNANLVDHVSGGGGGVGIYGEGASGNADTDGFGEGGSGGTAGGYDYHGTGGGGPVIGIPSSLNGGKFGGGGGGQSTKYWIGLAAGQGGPGAVRIIWGAGRAFPSTNVALVDSTDGETTV